MAVAGKIIVADVIIEDLLYGSIDPLDVLTDIMGEYNPTTGLRPLLDDPANDGRAWVDPTYPLRRARWFDPKFAPEVDESDYFITIVDGKYVRSGHATSTFSSERSRRMAPTSSPTARWTISGTPIPR